MMLGFGKNFPDETADEMKLMRQSRYGIGTKRTLDQAKAFTGISFESKKMDTNKCGNLLWVPYEESSDYGVGEILSRGHAGEDVRQFIVAPDISRSVNQAQLAGLALRTHNFNVRVSNAPTNYKLLGGILLVALAVLLKVYTGKREKDENHKV